jgi:hypothetical protein
MQSKRKKRLNKELPVIMAPSNNFQTNGVAMKSTIIKSQPVLLITAILLGSFLIFTSCRGVEGPDVTKGNPNIVEVTTEHNHQTDEHLFNLNKEEVPEGWTRFRLVNATHADHFYLLYKLPQAAIDAADEAGRPVKDHWYQTVTIPFQEEYNPFGTQLGTVVSQCDNLRGTWNYIRWPKLRDYGLFK